MVLTVFFLPGPEKYDFNLYKGFFVEKMTQIRQILKFFLMISSSR
jgi:hypothetical protein